MTRFTLPEQQLPTAWFNLLASLPEPLQPPPDQPPKSELAAGVAARVTPSPPCVIGMVQAGVQLMPSDGDEATMPVPLPSLMIVSVPTGVNVAVTVVGAVIVTVQPPVPPQPPPLQPVKTEPAAGIAVSVTVAPWLYDSPQSVPQSMPAPLTVPLPLPFLPTDSA